MRLYGKNPVLERIIVCPNSIRELYLQKGTDLSHLALAAKAAGIFFKSCDKTWFKDNCDAANAQGVLAEVDEFEYTPFSIILNECQNGISIPVYLDGITDPQNLGAIIRNLACLGGFSLVLSEHNSASVNETVLRVANGGENYVRISKVENIATSLRKIKHEGIYIIGAVVEEGGDILKSEIVYPAAVVIGSEGKGIRPGVKKLLDAGLSLPMKGASLSYNAASATLLFCYEITRDREKNKFFLDYKKASKIYRGENNGQRRGHGQ
ncbi:MAG: RNA methyltransferase [Candidatus Omnitrophota bacterium]